MWKGSWLGFVLLACGRTQPDSLDWDLGLGGTRAVAGASARGGNASLQGGAFGAGGSVARGGAFAQGGVSVARGGAFAQGGVVARGGGPAGGGVVARGGALATGGSVASGGKGFGGKGSDLGGAGGSSDAGAGGEAGSARNGSASCFPDPLHPSLAFFGLDVDFDEDGVFDADDNCPAVKNPRQEDADHDGLGDACDACAASDSDGDGYCDALDVCPTVWDPAQSNVDGQFPGDACDATRACWTSGGPAEAERALALALSDARLQSLLVGARWRLILPNTTFCPSDGSRGRTVTLFVYAQKHPTISVTFHDDRVVSVTRLDNGSPQDPAPTAEETREANQLALGNSYVAAQVAAGGLSVSGFFHADTGEFPVCAAGRCIEVLYTRAGNIQFRAVVDLSTCTMLGVLPPS